MVRALFLWKKVDYKDIIYFEFLLHIDKILNYRMFERKIRFSEDMINSSDLMEKKSALDFLIDSLQYLISIQDGNRTKQYSQLAISVNQNTDLYRLRELELLAKGVVPLPVDFPTKERRKEKIYPNEKCPCGSGLKYKKCHGRL